LHLLVYFQLSTVMHKKLAGWVIILILVNVSIKLVWIFGVERGVQLAAGFEAYGLYYSLFNFSFVLSIITDPGINNYLLRSVAQKVAAKENVKLFSLKLILSAIYIIITFLSALCSGYDSSYFVLLFWLSLYHVLWSFLNFLRSYLKGAELYKAETVFSVLDKLLLILLFIPLLVYEIALSSNLLFFALSQVIAVAMSIVCCALVLHKNRIHVIHLSKLKPDFSILKSLMPFTLFTFLVLAYNKIDSIMLEKMLPNGQLEAGIYAAAYRLLDASNIIYVLFASLFFPTVSRFIAEGKNIQRVVKESFELLMVLAIIISSSCWFFKVEMMHLLYGDKSSNHLADVFGLLMFNSPFIVLYYIFSSILTAANKLKALNIISGMGLLINIVLNCYLIPQYLAYGAALSTLIALVVAGLSYQIFYHIYFEAEFPLRIILKLFGFVAILVLGGYLLKYSNIHWILSLFIFISSSIITSFIIKLLSLEKIKDMLKMV